MELMLAKCVSSVFVPVLLVMGNLAVAQIEIKGVGFDPAPLEFGPIAQFQAHPMTKIDLLTMRNFYGVQISPDGKSVAFVVGEAVYESNSYKSGLFVIDTAPGSVPKSLGTAGPPRWDFAGQWTPEAPKWSPDSRYIAYRLKTNGTWQVWRWDRDGSNPFQLTHVSSDVIDFSWSHAGKEVIVEVNKVPLPDTIQRLQERGMLYEALTSVFENKSIIQQEIEQLPNETETWTVNVESGQERELTQEEQAQREAWKQKLGDKIADTDKWVSGYGGNILDPKLSPDGSKAIFQSVNSPSSGGYTSYPLYLKKLGESAPVVIDSGTPIVVSYWWSTNGQHIYLSTSLGDGHSRYLCVASSDGGKAVRLFPRSTGDGYFDDFSISDSGKFAAATLENNTIPPEIALIDLENGIVRRLVDINPQFNNIRLSAATRIEWTSKYGEQGHGYLVKPLDYEPGHRYPLIVTTYTANDTFLRGGGGEEYPIQVFAANGFAVLAWDHGMYPADPTNGDFEQGMQRYKLPAASLEAALAAVDKLGIVDRRRCGLTGFSYGTEIADYVVSQNPDLFSTAITSGMSGRDPYFYYMAPRFWKKIFADWGLQLPSEKSWARWREYSTSLNADRIHAALLSNASEDDFMTVFQLYTTLEEMGKPVELFLYPNELHFKVQPKHLYEIYERNVDWFSFWLQDREDRDPRKKAQYKRWHHLRDLHIRGLARPN